MQDTVFPSRRTGFLQLPKRFPGEHSQSPAAGYNSVRQGSFLGELPAMCVAAIGISCFDPVIFHFVIVQMKSEFATPNKSFA